MKYKAAKSSRLADTEISIHFSGPIGFVKNRHAVEMELEAIVRDVAKRMKQKTDELREKQREDSDLSDA